MWVPGGCGCRGNVGARGMRVPGLQIPGGCGYPEIRALGNAGTKAQRYWVGVCALVCPQTRRGPRQAFLEAILGC